MGFLCGPPPGSLVHRGIGMVLLTGERRNELWEFIDALLDDRPHAWGRELSGSEIGRGDFYLYGVPGNNSIEIVACIEQHLRCHGLRAVINSQTFCPQLCYPQFFRCDAGIDEDDSPVVSERDNHLRCQMLDCQAHDAGISLLNQLGCVHAGSVVATKSVTIPYNERSIHRRWVPITSQSLLDTSRCVAILWIEEASPDFFQTRLNVITDMYPRKGSDW